MSGTSGVRSTVGAADAVAQALATFHRSALALTDSATSAMREAASRAKTERDQRKRLLAEARRKLQAAEAALAACEENCDGLRRAVATAARVEREASDRFDRSEQAVKLIEDSKARLSGQTRTFVAAVERSVPGGQSAAQYRDQLKGYLTGSSSAAAGLSGKGTQVDPQAAKAARRATLLMAGREFVVQAGIELADELIPYMKTEDMPRGLVSTVADVVRDPGMRLLAKDEFTTAVSKVKSRLFGG